MVSVCVCGCERPCVYTCVSGDDEVSTRGPGVPRDLPGAGVKYGRSDPAQDRTPEFDRGLSPVSMVGVWVRQRD